MRSGQIASLFLCSILAPPSHAKDKFLESILKLPDSKIDIVDITLTLEKEANPTLDKKRSFAEVDRLASLSLKLMKDPSDPDQRIRAINTAIFIESQYSYDREGTDAQLEGTRFLSNLVETKGGNCYTLPILYVAVAQKLKYPIYPVPVPTHFFLKYQDPSLKEQNIDPAGRGGYSPDEDYIEDFSISAASIKSKAYLVPMIYKEYVGEIVLNLAIVMAKRGHIDRGLELAGYAVRFRKNMPEAYRAMATMYRTKGESEIAKNPSLASSKNPPYLTEYVRNLKMAKDIGFIKLTDEEFNQNRAKRKLRQAQASLGG